MSLWSKMVQYLEIVGGRNQTQRSSLSEFTKSCYRDSPIRIPLRLPAGFLTNRTDAKQLGEEGVQPLREKDDPSRGGCTPPWPPRDPFIPASMPPSTGAADAASKPEKKTNKKVSRACNTCRLKRTKCDGQDPCFFCVDTHNECSYSREPRRRGPPSGYLRHIETRLIILETFLGLLISRSPSLSPTLTPLAHHLHDDSKPSSGVTQDVWDTYREHWTKEESCRVLEETVVGFTGFVKKEDEGDSSTTTSGLSSGFKPLLPLKGGDDGTGTSIGAKTGKKSATVATQQLQSRIYSPPTPPSPPSLYFHPQSNSVAPTESFERTTIRSSPSPSTAISIDPRSHFQHRDALNFTNHQIPTYDHPVPSSFTRLETGSAPGEGWPEPMSHHAHDPEHASFMSNFSFGVDAHSIAGPSEENMNTRGHLQASADSRMDSDLPSVLPQAEDGNNTTYTGSYWRTATAFLDHQSSPTSTPQITDQTDPSVHMHIDLPPTHIMSHLLDVYYDYVHPMFPFLPGRNVVDELEKRASATSTSSIGTTGDMSTHTTEGNVALLLAICGYAGQLSPSSDTAFTPSVTKPSTILGGSIANKIAADLWYEQARNLVMNRLRRAGSSLEGIQTLLLCALRDQGKGRESQAWLLLGLAVRMGQDLGLHSDSTDDGTGKEQAPAQYSGEELAMRRRVWGVTHTLDLYLSLQLGRPPAIVDGHAFVDPSSTSSVVTDIHASTLNHDSDADHPLFAYTASLSRIISRINLYLYLALSGRPNLKTTTSPKPSSEMLKALERELDIWHQYLPAQFRISIGHQPTREVIELNMLYHVAIILLYRPFCKNRVPQATEVCLEAASTFNVLLSKYRSTHPLPLSNPHLIYLIYTVAIAHLSGYRQLEDVSTTTSLQTQLHLLNCLEAFKMIGQTWDLAGRCWRALNRLMDVEGMKPGSGENPAGSTLGKRKRRETPFGVEQQQQKRDGSLSIVTTSTLQDPSAALKYPSPSTSGGSNQDVFSSWPSSVSMALSAPTLSSSVPATTTSTDMLFDPDFFSSNTGWMPDVHMHGSFGEMWNTSDWDDNFWAKRLQTPVNMGMIDGDGNFVMGQSAGDLISSFVQP